MSDAVIGELSTRTGMALERVRALATFYAEVLREDAAWREPDEQNQHLIDMAPRLHALLDEGRIEKAMRWLGFIQGALWSFGYFTLDDLKQHSRPDVPPPDLASWRERNGIDTPSPERIV